MTLSSVSLTMRRRTISARNSEAPLSFFLVAELDLVVFLFSAAALAGLICDHSRCEIAVASAMDGAERD